MLSHGCGSTYRHENCQAGKRALALVEDGHCDPFDPLLKFLVRACITELPDIGQLAGSRSGVVLVSGDVFDRLLVKESKDRTPTGPGEERVAGSDLVFNAHDMRVGHDLQQDDGIVGVAHVHDNGLAAGR